MRSWGTRSGAGISEERLLENVRDLLLAHPTGGVREDTPLKVGTCTAVLRARDGWLLGYRVGILLEPLLGVP
jgi:hypothetical protein